MNWRRIRKNLLIAFSVTILAFCGVSWFVAGSLIAPANRSVTLPEDLPVEIHTIESDSGSTLATWLIRHPTATATVVLFHPIRGNRRSMLGRARLLYDAGFAIVMVDLQAHGESPGENITIGYQEKHDVRAAINFARHRNPDHRIGVVGRSLGGASTLLAVPVEIDALVLEAVYPTITDAVRNRVGVRLGSLKYVVTPALLCQLQPRLGISSADLRPIDFIDDVGCPVLIAAGDCDVHTPLVETRQMFEAACEPKKLVVFHGAKHENLLRYDRSKYESQIVPFLISNLATKN